MADALDLLTSRFSVFGGLSVVLLSSAVLILGIGLLLTPSRPSEWQGIVQDRLSFGVV